ncbi:MAG: extracellular solute-binding protein [Acholeplasmataceae bacterium]
MKRVVFVLLLALGILTISACATRRNEAPKFSGVDTNPTIEVGDDYDPLDGVTADDREDGDLTDEIVVDGWDEDDVNFGGSYEIILSVTDSDGETSRVTIYLTVESDIPLPDLEGVDQYPVHYIGSGTYDPLEGVTATDETDGDLTDEIEVLGSYDLDTPGTYTLRLRVTNSLGGRDTTTVILTVEDVEIPDSLTSEPIEITFWHAMGEQTTGLIRKYAESFMDEYPNITVNIPEGTGDYDSLKSNMINAITADEYPNMVQGYPDHVAEYLNGDVVLTLDPYIRSDNWGLHGDDDFEDIIESYREENSQYDLTGRFFSLPFNKSTEVMIYNRTLFDELELEVPETWQDLIAIAPQLKAAGDAIAEEKVREDEDNEGLSEQELQIKIEQAQSLVVPASYDSTSNAFITFTRQFDGAYTDIDFEDNNRGLYLWHEDDNTFEAMQFVKDNRDILTLPEFWDQQYASTPFVNEQTFVTVGSSAGIRYNIPGGLDENNPSLGDDFEVGVAPIPYNADKPDSKAVIQQGTNISILDAGGPQEQLASWLFLKHLISVENTIDWAMNTGYLPVRTSGYEHPDYQDFLADTENPIAITAQAAYEQSGYMYYDPAFVGSSRARDQVGLAFERIMLGDGNIEEALLDAYDEANLRGDE